MCERADSSLPAAQENSKDGREEQIIALVASADFLAEVKRTLAEL
jgi:hypothetical protein